MILKIFSKLTNSIIQRLNREDGMEALWCVDTAYAASTVASSPALDLSSDPLLGKQVWSDGLGEGQNMELGTEVEECRQGVCFLLSYPFPLSSSRTTLRAVFSWAEWSVSLASSVELGPWFYRKGWSWAAGRAVFETAGILFNTEAFFHMNLNLLIWICTCRSWGSLVTFVNLYSQTRTKSTFCPTLFFLSVNFAFSIWILVSMIVFLVIKAPFFYTLPHASFIA